MTDATSEFGDSEPEDSWDAGDTAIEMAFNLVRRLDVLDRSYPDRLLDHMIGDIEDRVDRFRRIYDELDERSQLRVDQLIEDLPTLRERARDGRDVPDTAS
jgi:hypothetical protein